MNYTKTVLFCSQFKASSMVFIYEMGLKTKDIYTTYTINIIMNNKCILCGWEWKGRVGNPAQCPRCKRYDWNKKRGEPNGEDIHKPEE